MKKGFLDRRIPTLFAFFILIFGIGITVILLRQKTFINISASPQEEPQNVKIVNTTDSSFTVTFTTTDKTIAGINIEEKKLPRIVYDKRDSSGKVPYKTHYIYVDNLKPQTTYKFKIISNGEIYLDNGKEYVTKTNPSSNEAAANIFPLAGQILLPNGEVGKDTLVYITISNAMPIGAVTDSNGNYKIPQSNIINKNTFNPLNLTKGTSVKIEANQDELSSNTNYTYIPNEIIPPITLNNNYSFIASDNANISSGSSLLALPTSSQTFNSLSITFPKKNSSITDSKPQIKGTATPKSLVKITIDNKPPIEAQVLSDSIGKWSYRPSSNISQGQRKITATSKINNVSKSVSINFSVFASGSQIAESATPSATLTPTKPKTTPTPTISPTRAPTLTVTTTLVPTFTITPTPELIVISTNTPTATATIPPSPPTTSPQQNIPPTGNVSYTILLTTLSLIFIVAGSVFLFIL